MKIKKKIKEIKLQNYEKNKIINTYQINYLILKNYKLIFKNNFKNKLNKVLKKILKILRKITYYKFYKKNIIYKNFRILKIFRFNMK